jgi:hypothetical protein
LSRISRKQILFHSVNTELEILKPVPTSKNIPKWFKSIKGMVGELPTIKRCIPFLDSLVSGYQIPLPAEVIWDSASKEFMSKAKVVMNSDHSIEQVPGVPVPEGFDPQPHKWINNWYIKTPKGYSTLFIHPLNRTDLPFYSISAIVDTDKHDLVINFPFFLKEGFSGVIAEGTPIIQAIPFKRDSWVMKVKDTGKSFGTNKKTFFKDTERFGLYKRLWWSKKEYN